MLLKQNMSAFPTYEVRKESEKNCQQSICRRTILHGDPHVWFVVQAAHVLVKPWTEADRVL